MSGWLRCPARACAWSAEITDVSPRSQLQHMPLLSGGGCWPPVRNRLGSHPTLHAVCSTCRGVRTVLLQVRIVWSPVPPFPPSATSIIPALLDSAGWINRGFFCLSICLPDWGKSSTWHQTSPSIWLCSQVSLETRPDSFYCT